MMDYSSTHLDSIISVPDRDTRAKVALTNTTNDELIATIISNQEGDRKVKPVTLGPRETQVVDLKEFINSDKVAPAVTLVGLEHNGAPGALITTGFALNEMTGFSCNLQFVDRSTAKSSHLAGAHVRFGLADEREGFPRGTRFFAPLIIANASDAPAKAHIYVDYTAGSEARRVDLGQIGFAAREVRQIELFKEMARRGVKGPVEDAGVDIEYSGQRGAVMARLTSVDISGDYAFDVPIKDPLAGMMRGSGGYPWRLDGGHTTVLHLKNTLDKAVYAIVQVRYEGGSYNLERIKMAAYQTVAVDIKRLRDGQEADIRDGVMPVDVESGQVVWYEEEAGSLIGRAEVADIASGVSASLSCPVACQCPPSFNSMYLTPSSSVGPVGGTAQFRANEMRKDCQGVDFGPYNRTQDSTWSSTNSAVMSVSAGEVSCLSAGSATVTARFEAVVYTLNCFNSIINPSTSGNVVVRTPHHLKVISDVTTIELCGSKRRLIKYQVVDVNGDHTGRTPTVETLHDPNTGAVLASVHNSCQNSNFSPFACSPDAADGTFTDQLWVGCPTPNGGEFCGFPEVISKWHWCPPNGQRVTLVSSAYLTHRTLVLVRGLEDISDGTHLFP
jgi:hypothetical protein